MSRYTLHYNHITEFSRNVSWIKLQFVRGKKKEEKKTTKKKLKYHHENPLGK